MQPWKMPPKAKVYEALSAVADGRVEILGPLEAQVTSSGGDKTYKVRWSEDGRAITSSDPASLFQGYIGYPIIAVLLATGRLTFDLELAAVLAGVPWKTLNDRHKRDYDAAVDEVLRERPGQAADLRQVAGDIFRELEAMKLERLSGGK